MSQLSGFARLACSRMSILTELKARFRSALAGLADEPDELLDMIRRSQDPKFGDYQANLAMPLGQAAGPAAARSGRRSGRPAATWPTCASRRRSPGRGSSICGCATTWLVERLAAAVHDPRLGVAPVARPRTFVVDYSAPNVAKPMHVGPHPLDGHRRCPVPHAAVPRPRGDQRQSPRRLGHPVRHDPLWLQALPRRGGLSAEAGRTNWPGSIGWCGR